MKRFDPKDAESRFERPPVSRKKQAYAMHLTRLFHALQQMPVPNVDLTHTLLFGQ